MIIENRGVFRESLNLLRILVGDTRLYQQYYIGEPKLLGKWAEGAEINPPVLVLNTIQAMENR